jgi:hypothetical protein
MSVPTPQEMKQDLVYYKHKGAILTLMAACRNDPMQYPHPIPERLITEVRQAGWTIVRIGPNFEHGFFLYAPDSDE